MASDEFPVGAKVRFTVGPLGAFDKHSLRPRRFSGEVRAGEMGTIADWQPPLALADWLGVNPDVAPDYLVPVHPSMIERI